MVTPKDAVQTWLKDFHIPMSAVSPTMADNLAERIDNLFVKRVLETPRAEGRILFVGDFIEVPNMYGGARIMFQSREIMALTEVLSNVDGLSGTQITLQRGGVNTSLPYEAILDLMVQAANKQREFIEKRSNEVRDEALRAMQAR